MIKPDTKFLIVGLGLIGGSYAMGLKEAGYTVSAIDKNQGSIDFALSKNIIDRGAVYDRAFLNEADIIVICIYPDDIAPWILENQREFKPGALITDVSGVKHGVIEPIQKDLRSDLEFLGAHPMAGKETGGVFNSDNKMFFDANFIIIPTAKNTSMAIDILFSIAKILKFKNISTLSIEEHDRMIGFVSQLTHVIAVSLMNCSDNENLKDYTGDSFRDLTRIAKINEDMWSRLFFMNKDILISEIEKFEKQVDTLKAALTNNDEKGLKNLFITSTLRREKFDR